MLNSIEHPDLHRDYYRLKSIEKGGMQAIETSAMNAMYEAIEQGKGREEAERIFFSFFNNKPCESKRTNAVS